MTARTRGSWPSWRCLHRTHPTLSARPAHPSLNRLFYPAGMRAGRTLAMAAPFADFADLEAEVKAYLSTLDETALTTRPHRRRSRTSSSNRPPRRPRGAA